jgi:hypothetical protein
MAVMGERIAGGGDSGEDAGGERKRQSLPDGLHLSISFMCFDGAPIAPSECGVRIHMIGSPAHREALSPR